ncbi:MAG: hypothetical protein E7363_02500 [Clostridiales bacterium]|nr:hypothetical protein [Clostridiales bacterium]
MENENNTNATAHPEDKLSLVEWEEQRRAKNGKNGKSLERKPWYVKVILFALIPALLMLSCVWLIIYFTQGSGAYNREAKHKYEQLDESLGEKMNTATFGKYYALNDHKITQVQFMEPDEESVDLKVFYEGKDILGKNVYAYAIFEVMIDYYNALAEAEESGNILYYLDAMQKIVDTMREKESTYLSTPIDLKLPANTAENLAVFNDVFNVSDVNDPNIIRQVGFLPYHVECVEHHYNNELKRFEYTYKISGISYCETREESTAEVEKSSKLLMEENYDKTHLKAYNREMTFSTYNDKTETLEILDRLSGDIYKIIDGVNAPYTVKTTCFEEMDLMKMFYQMKEGKFRFKKPKNFDVRVYKAEQKRLEEQKKKNHQ